MATDFHAQLYERSLRRNLQWYEQHLTRVLESAREKQARDIDRSIALARRLEEYLRQPVARPRAVAPRVLEPRDTAELMKPVEPDVLDVLLKAETKGAGERYLRLRCSKPPEERFYFRVVSSWDYGWQQGRPRARDHFPRKNIIRETLYRKNNVGPDPEHYRQPPGASVSVCAR